MDNQNGFGLSAENLVEKRNEYSDNPIGITYNNNEVSVQRSNGLFAPDTKTTLVIFDVAKVMEAYANGIRIAFEMGRQARMDEERLGLSDTTPQTTYLGVYDDAAYGVYNDRDRFETSKPYWYRDNLQTASFATYDEALSFAKGGIAQSKGLNEGDIPEMLYPLNWRQKI